MSTHPADCDLHTMAVRAKASSGVDTDKNRQWVTASAVEVGDRVDLYQAGRDSARLCGGTVTAVDKDGAKVRLTIVETAAGGGSIYTLGRNSRLWHSTAAQVEHIESARAAWR